MTQSFFSNLLEQYSTKYDAKIKKINSLEPELKKCSDSELREVVKDLKLFIAKGGSEDDVICKAFALVREATWRVLNLRHFDVQLIGGLVLHGGNIAEMKTGEGKTIVALLPAFLNALYGKNVHVITVNDYLAKRDASYVGRVHRFLGLTVGLIQENMDTEERKKNYNCDIVYVTNSELGFDYLRDNMANSKEDLVQGPLSYCIIDEVDSILIDGARTPLIISGQSEAPIKKYSKSTKLAGILQKNLHYLVDEKNQVVTLLEDGVTLSEEALGVTSLYDSENPWISYLLNSIKAKELFKLNTHYIISAEKEIVIIDEFTGRTMADRRWSEGLHQAVEAKEDVKIQDESQTLASITYQNLFLLYEKLSGMTGTAKTEEPELEKIYKLNVISVPTHRSIKRNDLPDVVYRNQYLKWQAIAQECLEMYKIGRPVLIGTTTIEKSELLAVLLREYSIPYRLLNARPENIENESDIVSQAGSQGSITIATNMAGRGTDILLGGNSEFQLKQKLENCFSGFNENKFSEVLQNAKADPDLADFIQIFDAFGQEYLALTTNLDDFLETGNNNSDEKDIWLQEFKKAYEITKYRKLSEKKIEKEIVTKLGGLHVIGTERHESRRIDNQLRGRAGRQGDPGSSKFFLSLDDRLLRLFGGDRITSLLTNIGLQDDTPIQSPILNRSLESAQKKVEAYYFEARKQIFEYDQVLNMQRSSIYLERKKILQSENLRDWIIEYGERTSEDIIKYTEQTKSQQLNNFTASRFQEFLGFHYPINYSIDEFQGNDLQPLFFDDLTLDQKQVMENPMILRQILNQQFQISYDLREIQLNTIEYGLMRVIEKTFLLQNIDVSWKNHLERMSSLRDSIKWRAYGQRNPLTDYKQESYNYFVTMLTKIRHRVIYLILRSKIIIEFDG